MIAKPYKSIFLLIFLFFGVIQGASSQEETAGKTTSKQDKYLKFYEYRGVNAIDAAVGTAVMNGDFQEPLFEIAMRVGYKRFITPYLNVNFSYNKFNLAYQDVYNEGFMSFDLNLEAVLMPNQKFSPFIFAGGGYNAANYFEQTTVKIQGGIGVEYIVMEKVGVKVFSDYNYVFSDELDGLVFGNSDDVYWRILVGVNFYFGGENKKEKLLKGQPTIINSNPIISHN